MNDYTNVISKELFAKEKILPFSSDKKINIDVVCDEILDIIENE